MKATKMTLIAALAVGSLLLLSPALRAGDAPSTPPPGGPPAGRVHGHNMRGHMNFDRLAEHLKLTAHQKSKVQAIFESQWGKMRKLQHDQSLSRKERLAKMKAIRKKTVTKLKGVLTVDQFQKLREMWAKRGGPRHGWRGGPPTDNGSAHRRPQS